MSWLLVLALLACDREGPSREVAPSVDVPFDRPPAQAPVSLLHHTGVFELPDTSLPGGAEVPDRFVLERVEALSGRRNAWGADLPFPADLDDKRFAPPGMRVFVGDDEVPYSTTGGRGGGAGGWKIARGRLALTYPRAPEPGELVVEHPQLRDATARLQFGSAGLEPARFARYHLTLDDITRQGLLLPAPATATWELTLPDRARFETWLALVPPPFSGRSDGAVLELVVLVDGEEHPVAHRQVRPDRESFEHWEVDLSDWAGQEVALELQSDPGANPDHDYVFAGAPVVHGGTPLPRRVVVIGVDTLRPDHLGALGYPRPTSPELDALAAQSAVFERAWAPAPRTRPSFRTATTGRHPLQAVGATSIAEVFSRHGFATGGVVANVHLHPRFDFHRGSDYWRLDPTSKADQQVDRALAWLHEVEDRDAFLFLHLMDPHLNYIAPRSFISRFVTDPDPDLPRTFRRSEVYRWERSGELDQRRREHIRALYDAEVAWTSHQLGRFLDELDGLGGTNLVVFHTDHGEEFWEHGRYEHNHSLYDELVRAALWVRPPGGLQTGIRPQVPATLADIAPTLYDYLGFDDVPATDGISLRPWIEDPAAPDPERPIPVGFLRYDTDRWGVVAHDHKYVLVVGTGDEELYDLRADPEETTDLSATADLEPFRRALSEAHHTPVGPGWRVEVNLKGQEPIHWELPAAAIDAGVVDPEAIVRGRANQAWGEPPSRTPDDVGRVVLSDDGQRLSFHPGPRPEGGQLYVLFSETVEPGGRVTRGDQDLRSSTQRDWRRWSVGTESLAARAGTILVLPDGEATRMRRLSGTTPGATGVELNLLETLGYLGGATEDPEEDRDSPPPSE